MYSIHIDHERAVVSLSLRGLIHMTEMVAFVSELRIATQALAGRCIRIRADVREFRPVAPNVAELLRQIQAFGLQSGVVRVAEVVNSNVTALQLNRIARESGTDRILRRFSDETEADAWLAEAA
ncbi:MAG: STAS/SEC14 domain-containing protein [Myxococcota bacterium]